MSFKFKPEDFDDLADYSSEGIAAVANTLIQERLTELLLVQEKIRNYCEPRQQDVAAHYILTLLGEEK